MKTIVAERVKDGWYVQIIDTRHVVAESDVLKLIKQEGLEVRESLSSDERIIAE